MTHVNAHTIELIGTNYEIGYQLGEMIQEIPLIDLDIVDKNRFSDEEMEVAFTLFDQWCPGIVEELNGFIDASKLSKKDVLYYSLTYLLPRCSQIALLPSVTNNQKSLLARNYEFAYELEDFCLMKTSVKNKYTHIGTSMLHFGRDEGFNECGLAITMSSCGMPVVELPHLEKPKVEGIQYWLVIRALLENCKDVNEAVQYMDKMPIAFNMNMILLDKAKTLALVQIYDGKKTIKYSSEPLMYATNHSVLSKLSSFEENVMANSIKRYETIGKHFYNKKDIASKQVKDLLLLKYPEGLCFNNFKQWFGTTKSILICVEEGIIEICWGGKEENGWDIYHIDQPMEKSMKKITLDIEERWIDGFEWQPSS